MTQVLAERYYQLVSDAGKYHFILQHWQPVLLIAGIITLIVCLMWLFMALKLLDRNHFLEERNRILFNILVNTYGHNRDELERLLRYPLTMPEK